MLKTEPIVPIVVKFNNFNKKKTILLHGRVCITNKEENINVYEPYILLFHAITQRKI